MSSQCPECGWTSGKHVECCPIDRAEDVSQAEADTLAAVVAWLRWHPEFTPLTPAMRVLDELERDGSDIVRRWREEQRKVKP